jgi:integrase
LDVLQKVLGHASRKITAVYVDPAREEMDKQLQENALAGDPEQNHRCR